MDDQRIGWALRAIRSKRQWRQEDLAIRAGVSRWVVMRIERGRLAGVPVAKVRRVATALDARVDMTVRWQGGDLERLINAHHAAMHEVMARFFAARSRWVIEPEVSFSIWGERGTVDILAWHPEARALLVVELKSELIDLNELLGTLDRKRRLATQIADTRSWNPACVSVWVVVADSRTNRRAVAAHAAVIRNKLPTDGRGIGRWLGKPDHAVGALSFLPSVQGTHLDQNRARQACRSSTLTPTGPLVERGLSSRKPAGSPPTCRRGPEVARRCRWCTFGRLGRAGGRAP